MMKIHPFARTFPIVARNILSLPSFIVNMNPVFVSSQSFQTAVAELTAAALAEAKEEQTKEARTILHSIVHNPAMPEEEKQFKRICNEAMILFGAGTETTGRTLTITFLHILLNPAIHSRLLAEIQPLVPSYAAPLPSVAQLEALPYLTAVISEGLRISHGVSGRLSRIAPDEDLIYPNGPNGPVVIPAGATFSQSPYLVHTDEATYPEPFTFRPERFLVSEGATDSEKAAVASAKANLVPFGRGTRACVGLNLAYSELYLTIAAVIGGLKLELAEGMSAKDGQIVAEFFVGAMNISERGIAVKVLERGRRSMLSQLCL